MKKQDQNPNLSNRAESILIKQIQQLLSRNLSYNETADLFRLHLHESTKKFNCSPTQLIDRLVKLQSRQVGPKGKNNAILEFLDAYRISTISRRRKGTSQQISDASDGKVKLDSALLNEIALMQNRARGKIYEKMGQSLVEYYLREIEKYEGPINIVADKTTFDSFDSNGKRSKRRFDLYLVDFRIGVEIKSGRVNYHRSIRDQIHKDYYLLKNNLVTDVWWFLFYGASQKTLAELLKRKINFIDLGLNDFEDAGY